MLSKFMRKSHMTTNQEQRESTDGPVAVRHVHMVMKLRRRSESDYPGIRSQETNPSKGDAYNCT